jgi:large exoprotein involved in heme utilization and adhesion
LLPETSRNSSGWQRCRRSPPPKTQLFKINPAPGASYLVETDPAFTNYRSFLGSDYFEQQLGLDSQRTWKRYGDGYEEQRLINDQILALTGRRYLSGSTDTETEYKALMDAGVAYAKAYQLTPGVAPLQLGGTDAVMLKGRSGVSPVKSVRSRQTTTTLRT